MRVLWIALAALLVAGCGGTPAPQITAQQVFDRLQKSGLVTNGRAVPAAAADEPYAKCTDRLGFDMPGVDGLAGVVNICPKAAGDAIMAQPTVAPLEGALAGIRVDPYIYRSAGGTVIVTVVGLAPPDAAQRIGNEVALIPE